MLFFTLLFTSVVVPFVLIGGLVLMAMRPPDPSEALIPLRDGFFLEEPQGSPALALHSAHRAPDWSATVYVPSILVEDATWAVHLN